MTRFILVRHGRAAAVAQRCIGQTDAALSPEGAEDLRRLVQASSTPIRATRLVSSDLRRAAESAEIIAGATSCVVETDSRLREMHFGEWDGRLWSDVEQNDAARFRDWMDDWINVATPGGESAMDLSARAASWLTDTLPTAAPDDCIIVVSHAGWIRAALVHLLRRDVARMFDAAVEHARATIVDIGLDGRVLIASNAMSLEPRTDTDED